MHLGRSMALLIGASVLVSACSTTSAPPSTNTGGSTDTSDSPAGAVTASALPAAGSPSARAKLSAADLQGRWWTWAASSTSDSNPVSDQDGHLCAKGQSGGIWFLAGTFGGAVTRTCTVPAGVPVAFPLVNSFGEAGDCDEFMASARGSAVLDGRALEPRRHEATAVQISAVDGNPVTQDGGRFRTQACGLWVQLDPPAPGSHTLGIRGSSGSFSVSVDYKLQVSAG
ncbi:signal protein [Streptomyces sp. NBC_00424]|uniref:signal protein n=1 Tax=Streptomyces sp. NBC_00424 TaxID=2903648 RepID=UPI0022558C2E|nr:signal protein [Streptomyces sp. NBC_00424]MCX5078250.1 signal protein [Streptomyces sp. NBC_00424]